MHRREDSVFITYRDYGIRIEICLSTGVCAVLTQIMNEGDLIIYVENIHIRKNKLWLRAAIMGFHGQFS